MATALNSPSTSDIGPLSDSSSLGEPGRAPASDAAAASARKPRADSGEPVIEPADEPSGEEQPRDFNGAGATNGDAHPVTEERPPASAEDKKETTTIPEALPPLPPVTAPGTDTGGQEPRVGMPWPALDYSKEHEAVEAELLERMRAKYGTTLVSDMDDAQLLLSYVTRNGLQEDRKVSDDIIQTLIASREHMRSMRFDSEKEEAKFRKSYGIIAKAAEPVTVASLRDSTTSEESWGLFWYIKWLLKFLFPSISTESRLRPVAEVACLRYRRWAILVLGLLLFVQIYWTITSSVLNKADALITEINTLAVTADQQRRAEAPATSPTPAPEVAPGSVRNEPRRETWQTTLLERGSKIGELNASYTMLRYLTFFDPEATTFAGTDETTAESIFAPTHSQIENSAIRTIAGQVVDVMQKWLLPLLYGALGAMVFVVRTLSVQARDRLFRKEALVSLVLRVYLGMISGLAIGWFWNYNPEGPTAAGALTPSSLSPFALAFVAGYGVELFFAVLDKIVSTFTNK